MVAHGRDKKQKKITRKKAKNSSYLDKNQKGQKKLYFQFPTSTIALQVYPHSKRMNLCLSSSFLCKVLSDGYGFLIVYL